MYDEQDFKIGYEWEPSDDERNVLKITHFHVSEENRGMGRASAILETMVRIAYYEGAESIHVSMGGGKAAEAFLERNGFQVIRQREYEYDVTNVEGEYGVDAVRSIRNA